MIRSMTGFGSATADRDGTHYLLEIRSLNNKFFKAQVRLPEELQGLEAELESHAAKRLSRGSVVISVRISVTSADAAARINTQAVQRYMKQLLEIPGVESVDAGLLLALPGVLITDTGEQFLERARDVVFELVDQSCDAVLVMRQREGQTLHTDLHRHCERIREHLAVIKQRSPEVVQQYQQRLRQRMEDLLSDSGRSIDDADLLHEVAIFAERSDIAEEISRLGGHVDQFLEIIDAEDTEPVGRTLDFISQEMLREANTIASKCLDVEVSRRIVEIKSAIDRIKEQSQNVE